MRTPRPAGPGRAGRATVALRSAPSMHSVLAPRTAPRAHQSREDRPSLMPTAAAQCERIAAQARARGPRERAAAAEFDPAAAAAAAAAAAFDKGLAANDPDTEYIRLSN